MPPEIFLDAAVIRDVCRADAQALVGIYNEHVRNTVVTFEETPADPLDYADRISAVSARYPWLVAEQDGRVAGFAYACEWKNRSAYRHTAEVSIYIDPACQRRGLGRQLYSALFDRLESAGVHLLIAGISLPNEASVALHEKFGFTAVGRFNQVGKKFDRWIDVGYWQLKLSERLL